MESLVFFVHWTLKSFLNRWEFQMEIENLLSALFVKSGFCLWKFQNTFLTLFLIKLPHKFRYTLIIGLLVVFSLHLYQIYINEYSIVPIKLRIGTIFSFGKPKDDIQEYVRVSINIDTYGTIFFVKK